MISMAQIEFRTNDLNLGPRLKLGQCKARPFSFDRVCFLFCFFVFFVSVLQQIKVIVAEKQNQWPWGHEMWHRGASK